MIVAKLMNAAFDKKLLLNPDIVEVKSEMMKGAVGLKAYA